MPILDRTVKRYADRMTTVGELGRRAQAASRILATAPTAAKNAALLTAAALLSERAGEIQAANAADLAAAEAKRAPELAALRDELEAKALGLVPETVVLAGKVERLPNTSCIAVPGTKAETLVIGLDLAGVAVSAGSACSSGKVEASHVLSAMGVPPELAQGAIRVSLGFGTTSADIERFIGGWSELIKRMRQRQEAA